MQPCAELCMLTSSRRLAHGCQPVRRGAPAQCPGRGRPAAVSLGRGPLLHSLRGRQAPFVRPLLSSYYLVRLLIRVHVHRIAIAFMNRPGSPPGTDENLPGSVQKTSPHAWGLRLRGGRPSQANCVSGGVAFSSAERDRRPELDPFRSSISNLPAYPQVADGIIATARNSNRGQPGAISGISA